jgi:hypothetical protein
MNLATVNAAEQLAQEYAPARLALVETLIGRYLAAAHGQAERREVPQYSLGLFRETVLPALAELDDLGRKAGSNLVFALQGAMFKQIAVRLRRAVDALLGEADPP